MDSIIEIITQIIGATIGATIGAIITNGITTRGKSKAKEKQEPKPKDYRVWASGVVTFLVVFTLIGILIPEPPTVEITSPITGANIVVQSDETGTGYFSVGGNSKNVTNQLRIYILIHPVKPYAEGWFFDPIPITPSSDGSWSGQAQIGSSKYPPHVGDKLDILAIDTTPEQVQNRHWVPDPEDLSPKAKSAIVHVSIGSITRTGINAS